MATVEVEAYYEEQAADEDGSQWKEKPLSQLRLEMTSEPEKKLLEKILLTQAGTPHPQDPLNPDLRLYWVFQENTQETKKRNTVGHRVGARGEVEPNKAARTALADHIVGKGATFGKGTGSSGSFPTTVLGAPPGAAVAKAAAKAKAKGKAKAKKVIVFNLQHITFPSVLHVAVWQPSS